MHGDEAPTIDYVCMDFSLLEWEVLMLGRRQQERRFH